MRSVDDALDFLTATEAISGYKPQETSAPVDATKAVRLQRLPNLLVLFLMRFDPANLRQKIRCGGWGWWQRVVVVVAAGGGSGGGGVVVVVAAMSAAVVAGRWRWWRTCEECRGSSR